MEKESDKMKERFTNVIVTDLIIMRKRNDTTEILLSKRKNTGYKDGEYELPGGHLEKDEDIFDSRIREAKEELNISLERNDLKILHIMHHYTGNRINFIFLTEKSDIVPQINEPEKCEELRWANINNLPNNTMEKVKTIIGKIILGEMYSKM